MLKYIFFAVCAFITHIHATCDVNLDLKGNGQMSTVQLPYPYFEKKPNDQFKIITQGGCHLSKATDVHKVIVIGPVQPCVAITVTDGETVAAFHAHSTNRHDNMQSILKEAFPNGLQATWAHIFSAADNVEWTQSGRTRMHGGLSHDQAVTAFQETLIRAGVSENHIQQKIYDKRDHEGNLKYDNLALGRYELAESCVAVRMDNLLMQEMPRRMAYTSIDLATEDVFGFSESYMSPNELQGVANPAQKTQTTSHNISYNALPALFAAHNHYDTSGLGAGVRIQRGIVERYEEALQNKRYQAVFKQSVDQLMGTSPYQSLNFFKIR